MTDDRATALSIVLGLLFLIVVLSAAFHTVTECHAAGGTTVRGLFWLECIR